MYLLEQNYTYSEIIWLVYISNSHARTLVPYWTVLQPSVTTNLLIGRRIRACIRPASLLMRIRNVHQPNNLSLSMRKFVSFFDLARLL